MCEKCYQELTTKFMEWSKNAERDGRQHDADVTADFALFADLLKKAKTGSVANPIFGLLTLAAFDQTKFMAMAETISMAIQLCELEIIHDSADSSVLHPN